LIVTGFRNIHATPRDPVTAWGFEGLLAAIERGGMQLWDRIAAEVRRHPYGDVARLLEAEVIDAVSHPGERELFRPILLRMRHRWEQDARAEVEKRLRSLLERSGLNQRDFATQLGTSASRLSTYLHGKVTPGADLLVRAERVSGRMKQNGSAPTTAA
jgi:Helix-turn-helix